MAVPAPPRITAVTLSPTTINSGVPILALVEWTGFPMLGVRYQWRRSGVAIRGETSAVHTPTGAWTDLDCLVTIDNGRGTAASASPVALQPPPPEPGEGPQAFSTGFSEGFE